MGNFQMARLILIQWPTKILKPDDWEEKYAPEPAIKKELQRQLKAYERHKERKEQ